MKRYCYAAALLLLVTSCEILNQAAQMANFARCDFRLHTLQNLRLAGVNVQNVRRPSDLSLTDAARVASAYLNGSLPLDFTLNVQVKNPNDQPAAMNQMNWILLLDDQETVRGQVDRRVTVAQNGVATLPLRISLDLREFFEGRSRESLLNLALNLAGSSNTPSNVRLRIQPSVEVAGTTLQYPSYIDVDNDFGGGGS